MLIFSELFGQNLQTDRHRVQVLAILRPSPSSWHVRTPFWIRACFENLVFLLISMLVLYNDRIVLQIIHE